MNQADKKTAFPLPFSELEERIGYTFKDDSLLREALTHSSYANEQRAHTHREIKYNERLEFLGDSVLSLAASEFLYAKFSERPEGELTKIRAAVVCERALAEFAAKIDLGSYLYFGKGEETAGGRERKSLLADAFEALLAAIYLDAGADGFDTVKKFLLPFIETQTVVVNPGAVTYDYKTLLQQIVQQAEGEILEYVLVGESGPAHARIFEIEARLNSNVIGHGTGGTKREAEQHAAREAVELFGEAK